jgi:hypothetical protein
VRCKRYDGDGSPVVAVVLTMEPLLTVLLVLMIPGLLTYLVPGRD